MWRRHRSKVVSHFRLVRSGLNHFALGTDWIVTDKRMTAGHLLM